MRFLTLLNSNVDHYTVEWTRPRSALTGDCYKRPVLAVPLAARV